MDILLDTVWQLRWLLAFFGFLMGWVFVGACVMAYAKWRMEQAGVPEPPPEQRHPHAEMWLMVLWPMVVSLMLYWIVQNKVSASD